MRAALPLSAVAQAVHSRKMLPADLAPIGDWHRSTLHEAQSSSSGAADGPGLSSAGHDSMAAGEVPQQSLEVICSSDTESQSCQPAARSKEHQEAFPDVKYQQVWHSNKRSLASQYASIYAFHIAAYASAAHNCHKFDMMHAPSSSPEVAHAGCELGQHCRWACQRAVSWSCAEAQDGGCSATGVAEVC